MTVSQLRVGPESAGLAELVDCAQEMIAEAAAAPADGADSLELGHVLASLTSLEAQVVSLRLEVLAEADRRRAAEAEAYADTEAWAARLTGTTRAVMAGGLWLVRMLRERYETARRAFATGAISEEQVRVIVRAAERLPSDITDAQRAEAEAALVAKARDGMNPSRLRHAARRMAEAFSKDLADKCEAEQLEEEEQHAEVETWMTLHDNEDGTFSGKFTIPEMHGHLLKAALERLSAPRRLNRNAAGELVVDDTLPTGGPSLNWSEQLGAAFLELLEHLPTTGHGGVAATLLVTIGLEELQAKLGAARLDTGVAVSPGEARRLACEAGIVPMVLGGSSQVLDAGRTMRLHTEKMRQALAIRHDSCAAEGCERPFAWCEIHHPHAWSEGGHTSVDNAIPLCWHHHRRVHDERYRHRFTPVGEVRFSWRRPRRPKGVPPSLRTTIMPSGSKLIRPA